MNIGKVDDEFFMRAALKEAQLAFDEGEVPVGAVVVSNGRIIAKGHNQVERLSDVTAHAEMIAITSASEYLGSKFLDDCTMYVTLEPCLMCATALKHARIHTLVFAAHDERQGFSTLGEKILHKKTEVRSGFIAEESVMLLQEFFAEKR